MPKTELRSRIRDLALDLLPPVVSRQVLQHVGLRARERVSTLEELDRWIQRADAAGATSDDELRRVLSMFEFVTDTKMPRDPFSKAYQVAQKELYAKIAGHRQYRAEEHERTPFDPDAALHLPFPYSTRSTATVGEQLARQGLLLRLLRLRPTARVVEFGAGWGNLTLELAKMGLTVTAVDVDPKFGELVSQRASQLGLTIQIVTSDMLDFRADEPFDAAIFFESFHHCSDHLQMLSNLRDIVKEEGIVAFGSEPITALPYPWGLRLDGMSVWSTRKFGWLENGFTPRYFGRALDRTAWKAESTFSRDIPGCSVIVAHRRSA
jgi:2-polyprenyl-3-methyl-5-hydroxy-6-metoxy-1,4-benzoquinol methylase